MPQKPNQIIVLCFDENNDKHTVVRKNGNHALRAQPTD